jgi:hypothetical protein
MKSLFTIILLVICSSALFSQVEEYNDLVLGFENGTIQLEKDLSYYYLTASNSYLAWYEGYTNQVYYQNLINGKIGKIKPKKGRGPFEILSIRGLVIISNQLFLLDSQNNKIVSYNMDKSEFVNEFITGRYRIQFITSSLEKVYGKAINRKAIYFEIDPSKEEIMPIEKSFEENFTRDMNRNIFRFEGPFLANSEYLISVRTYEPSMYIFDLDGELNDFEYDETNLKPEYEFNEFGMATRPPLEVNMNLHDAALKPNSNIIYLAREGYTEKYPKNNRSILYQYDYVKREYVGVLETGVESIGKIATNDRYLFVYDDKNFKIIKIKL